LRFKFIPYIAILLILFIGMAGAVTVTTATWNAGHPAGDKFPGTVQASDLYATDDLLVGDDAQVLGDFSCSGIGTFTGGTITSNVYSDNLRLAANKSFYSTAGSGGIDWSNGTGTWKMPTGAGTIAGTTDFNGAITSRNITLDANYNIVTSGTGSITSASTITGEQLTSTDDAYITDDLTVDGAARIDETATINAGVINSTLDVNGATTTAAITVDSGSIVTADQYKRRTSTSATNTTITDGGPDVYLVGNGTGVNTQTILFPTAADNKGRIITVILATDPVANTVILDGESSEQIDGAATKTTTDAVGSMYHLICDGVGWIKLVSSGTWS